MNKDEMSDDEQFEAFLRGDDALARRLQALDQPAPPAALDAAILARARTAMEREGTPAANDDAPLAPGRRQPKGLGWYWRIPAGIAATILVGVIARQSFESDPGTGVYEAAAVEAAAVEAAAVGAATVARDTVPVPAAEVADAASRPVQPQMPPARPEMKAAPKTAPAAAVQSPRKAAPLAEVAPALEENRAILMRPAPPPAPAPAPAPAHTAAAAPAPAPAATADNASARKSERVFVTGSRLRNAREAESSVAPAIISPEVLLEHIEKMLDEGRHDEVAAAWTALQRDYPDFPIPDTTREKLNKLRQ